MPEIPDAYQEYVAARRENDERDKIATLTLTADEMAAVWGVIADAIDTTKDLAAETKQRWESILRSLAKSVSEAS